MAIKAINSNLWKVPNLSNVYTQKGWHCDRDIARFV